MFSSFQNMFISDSRKNSKEDFKSASSPKKDRSKSPSKKSSIHLEDSPKDSSKKDRVFRKDAELDSERQRREVFESLVAEKKVFQPSSAPTAANNSSSSNSSPTKSMGLLGEAPPPHLSGHNFPTPSMDGSGRSFNRAARTPSRDRAASPSPKREQNDSNWRSEANSRRELVPRRDSAARSIGRGMSQSSVLPNKNMSQTSILGAAPAHVPHMNSQSLLGEAPPHLTGHSFPQPPGGLSGHHFPTKNSQRSLMGAPPSDMGHSFPQPPGLSIHSKHSQRSILGAGSSSPAATLGPNSFAGLKSSSRNAAHSRNISTSSILGPQPGASKSSLLGESPALPARDDTSTKKLLRFRRKDNAPGATPTPGMPTDPRDLGHSFSQPNHNFPRGRMGASPGAALAGRSTSNRSLGNGWSTPPQNRSYSNQNAVNVPYEVERSALSGRGLLVAPPGLDDNSSIPEGAELCNVTGNSHSQLAQLLEESARAKARDNGTPMGPDGTPGFRRQRTEPPSQASVIAAA